MRSLTVAQAELAHVGHEALGRALREKAEAAGFDTDRPIGIQDDSLRRGWVLFQEEEDA